MRIALIGKGEPRIEKKIAEISLDHFYKIALDLREFNKKQIEEFEHHVDGEWANNADGTYFWHLINNQDEYDPFADFDKDCCEEKYQIPLSGLRTEVNGVKMYGTLVRTSPGNNLILSIYVINEKQGGESHFQMHLDVPLLLIPKLGGGSPTPKASKKTVKGRMKEPQISMAARLIHNVFLPSLVFTETNYQIQLN